MTDKAMRQEIKRLIRFYERLGWNWIAPVAFLASKYFGAWPCARRWNAKAVRVDLSAIREAGGDRQIIDLARHELYYVYRLALEAMEARK